MKLTNLTVGTILALAVTLPTGQVLSQAQETTVNTRTSETEQNIDQAGENLQSTDNTTTTETTVVDDIQDTDNTETTTAVDELQNTDNTVEPTVDNTTDDTEAITTEPEEIVEEVVETDAVVEEKFNWDWLGLLGLLGLFGLTGKNQKTEVAHRDLGLGSATDTNGINHDVNNTDVNSVSNNVNK
jgi:hypothetical protein